MDPIRHTRTEDPVDVRACVEDMLTALEPFLTRQGDAVIVAGGLEVRAGSFGYAGGERQEIRRRIAQVTGVLRERAEALATMLEDERLEALAAADESEVTRRIAWVKDLRQRVEDALEAIALLEETPAVDLDLEPLHGHLAALADQVQSSPGEPLVASHVTTVEVKL